MADIDYDAFMLRERIDREREEDELMAHCCGLCAWYWKEHWLERGICQKFSYIPLSCEVEPELRFVAIEEVHKECFRPV